MNRTDGRAEARMKKEGEMRAELIADETVRTQFLETTRIVCVAGLPRPMNRGSGDAARLAGEAFVSPSERWRAVRASSSPESSTGRNMTWIEAILGSHCGRVPRPNGFGDGQRGIEGEHSMRKYGKWVLTLGLLAATPGLTLAAGPKSKVDEKPAAGVKKTTKTENQKVAEDIALAMRGKVQGDVNIE